MVARLKNNGLHLFRCFIYYGGRAQTASGLIVTQLLTGSTPADHPNGRQIVKATNLFAKQNGACNVH